MGVLGMVPVWRRLPVRLRAAVKEVVRELGVSTGLPERVLEGETVDAVAVAFGVGPGPVGVRLGAKVTDWVYAVRVKCSPVVLCVPLKVPSTSGEELAVPDGGVEVP